MIEMVRIEFVMHFTWSQLTPRVASSIGTLLVVKKGVKLAVTLTWPRTLITADKGGHFGGNVSQLAGNPRATSTLSLIVNINLYLLIYILLVIGKCLSFPSFNKFTIV